MGTKDSSDGRARFRLLWALGLGQGPTHKLSPMLREHPGLSAKLTGAPAGNATSRLRAEAVAGRWAPIKHASTLGGGCILFCKLNEGTKGEENAKLISGQTATCPPVQRVATRPQALAKVKVTKRDI